VRGDEQEASRERHRLPEPIDQKAVAQLRSVQGSDGAPEIARLYSVIYAK
jgi:hypothetical protein